jgi:acyl-[acyl-carrier-protein]-phospholipid O-acyltransferase/long-chain-fatty-acid--[acyl-carrier-protein] ligase
MGALVVSSNENLPLSFTYLNITQFIGALNDNIFKLLAAFLFIKIEGVEKSHEILALAGTVFVLPFLLFAAISGRLADHLSKSRFIIVTSFLETLVTIFGTFAIALESKWGCFTILFLQSTQSALFGPCKYGIIPELVSKKLLSRANGYVTAFTYLSIILGTFFTSFTLELTGKNFLAVALIGILFSLIGLTASFFIPYTPPTSPEKKIQFLFFYEHWSTFKESFKVPYLTPSIFVSAYFLFLGSYIQLNMIPFAVEALDLSELEGGYLFLISALGIASGSFAMGKWSKGKIMLSIVPYASANVGILLVILYLQTETFSLVLLTTYLLGFMGGLCIIPCDSYIQAASVAYSRGATIALTSFLGFLGVLVSSLYLWGTTALFRLNASEGFFILGLGTLIISGLFYIVFKKKNRI